MNRILLFLIFLMFTAPAAFSQSNSSLAYAAQADSLYRHHSYHDAAIFYGKALKKASHPGNLMLQIAKCYTNMNKIHDAEQWFQKAKTNGAIFSPADAYQYAHILMMVKKREEAVAALQALLQRNPDEPLVKNMLNDILNYKIYYKDSARYSIHVLNINSPMAEFSPAFYKDGLVFSSAQPQDFTKSKYHWDNTHFLNLYYSAQIDRDNFVKPVEFDKKLDTRFHDGPATFYADGERMIINRNEQHALGAKKGSSIWHLSLYEAKRDNPKKEWEFTLLPFNEPPYSFAHPAISPDGTVLYFVSNRPGGYGGNDIYRGEKKIWRLECTI